MKGDGFDAAAVRDWLLGQAVEVRHNNSWRSGVIDAMFKSGPEYKARYLDLLGSDDITQRDRVQAIIDVADTCPVDVRAKLYLAVTGLRTGSGEDVPGLLTEAAAMLGDCLNAPQSKAGRKPSKEVAARRIKVRTLRDDGMKPGEIANKLQIDLPVVYSDLKRLP